MDVRQRRDLVTSLERQIEDQTETNLHQEAVAEPTAPFAHLHKPLKQQLDLKALADAQGFQPIEADVFFAELDVLEIKEPLDTLLDMG